MPCFTLTFTCTDDQAKVLDLLHLAPKETFTEFLALALQIGLGHLEEEALKFLRDRQYDPSVPIPDRYKRYVDSKAIAPVEVPKVAHELFRRRS